MARPRRPFKFWTMAATSVLGTLVGLALAVLGDTAGQRLIGVALALLAGLAPAAGGWVLARQRLVLTPTRVVLAGPLTTVELPWEAVDEVEIFETTPRKSTTADMLGVTATDPDAVGWTRRERLGRLARGVTDYDICVGADSFAGTGEDVVNAIRRYVHERARRPRIGSQEELASLHRLLGLAGRT